MTISTIAKRWFKSAASVAVMAACLGGYVSAQDGLTTSPPKIVRTSKRDICVPIEFDAKAGLNVREICLYVKEGTGPWQCLDRCLPSTKQILCQLPHDGEYWLRLVTVDKNGMTNPRDVTRLEADIGVVVESASRQPVAPKAIQPVTEMPKAEVRPTPITPSVPAVTPVPVAAPAALAPSTVAAAPLMAPPPPTPAPYAPPAVVAPPAATPPSVPAAPALSSTQSAVTLPKQEVNNVLSLPSGPQAPLTAPTVSAVPSMPALPSIPSVPGMPAVPGSTPAAGAVQTTKYAPLPATTDTIKTPGYTVKHLNSTKVGIDYNIAKSGPSGVGRIEFWITGDLGATWQRANVATELGNHAEIILPGEGVYGIRMVGTNGHGFGGRAPMAGDQPTATFEVDLTAPVIQSLDVNSQLKSGALEIRWKATDKNLAGECVDLYYATQRGGPWEVIATRAPNTGLHSWPLPKNIAPQYFVRLEIRDQAGNMARTDSANPVSLDLQEPEINLVDLTPITNR